MPLAINNLSVDDLTEEKGFINAFTDDLNRPYLDNHIFLMFERNANSHEKFKTYLKIKNDPDLQGIHHCKINGKWVTIYSYVYKNTFDAQILKTGAAMISNNANVKIMRFWKGLDDDINDYFINRNYVLINEGETIPEEDSATNYELEIIKKGRDL